MKKFLLLAVLAGLFSCGNNNDGQGGSTNSDSARTEVGGVENVNGNLPDTTSTGASPNSGNNDKPVDSSYADTAHKTIQ